MRNGGSTRFEDMIGKKGGEVHRRERKWRDVLVRLLD